MAAADIAATYYNSLSTQPPVPPAPPTSPAPPPKTTVFSSPRPHRPIAAKPVLPEDSSTPGSPPVGSLIDKWMANNKQTETPEWVERPCVRTPTGYIAGPVDTKWDLVDSEIYIPAGIREMTLARTWVPDANTKEKRPCGLDFEEQRVSAKRVKK